MQDRRYELPRISIPRTSVNKRQYAGYLILTTMTLRRWIVVALGGVLLVAVVLGIFWFGWRELVEYINPKNATDRKDAIQVYALIVGGVVAFITAAVGLLNLRLTLMNLDQQRELGTQRAQGTALQAYYEQIGNLITEYELRNTRRADVRELARGQTLTVLQEVDGNGKGSLLTFLHSAGLIEIENPAVALTGAYLQGAYLQGADLRGVQGLTLGQLEQAVGNEYTVLPEYLSVPVGWRYFGE